MSFLFVQSIIVLTGVCAIWYSQSTEIEDRKKACIFGLVGQPFWMYSAYDTEQWGVYLLSIVYAFCWGKGWYNFYWRKNEERT